MTVTPTRRLTAEEVVALNRQYTFFSWSAQNKITPIAIDHGEGIYFWDPDGKRYIDFNSQLMSVNIGHGDRRVAEAIADQAHQLAFAAPPSPPAAGRTSRASPASSASSTRGAGGRPRLSPSTASWSTSRRSSSTRA